MVSRWSRIFVAVATALVAWLVATPARASAPLCDPRGATMIAPAPELQAPATSLDAAAPVSDSDDAPCSVAAASGRAWSNGRAPSPAGSSAFATSAALPASALRLGVDSPRVGSCVPVEDAGGERSGERARVDRPPRV
jgi:hypothetical protein